MPEIYILDFLVLSFPRQKVYRGHLGGHGRGVEVSLERPASYGCVIRLMKARDPNQTYGSNRDDNINASTVQITERTILRRVP